MNYPTLCVECEKYIDLEADEFGEVPSRINFPPRYFHKECAEQEEAA